MTVLEAVPMTSVTDNQPLWPDEATAFLFIRGLVVGLDSAETHHLQSQSWSTALPNWLITQGLGPLVVERYAQTLPQITDLLQMDAMTAGMENDLYFQALTRMVAAFNAVDVPVVLLKGCALASTAYPTRQARTMSDVDVWVQKSDIPAIVDAMLAAGFVQTSKIKQADYGLSAHGKIKFNEPKWSIGGLEIHTDPFASDILNQTSTIDRPAVWDRIRPISLDNTTAYLLNPEDMVLQVALHIAYGNHFSQAVIRGIIDIAYWAQANAIDWQIVAQRAAAWGVKPSIWLVLSLLQEILGMDEVAAAKETLSPSTWHKSALTRFVNPQRVIHGHDIRYHKSRYLLLSLLTNSPLNVVAAFSAKLRNS